MNGRMDRWMEGWINELGAEEPNKGNTTSFSWVDKIT